MAACTCTVTLTGDATGSGAGTVATTVTEAQGGQVHFPSAGYAIQFDSATSGNAQLAIDPLASTSSGSGATGQALFVIGQDGSVGIDWGFPMGRGGEKRRGAAVGPAKSISATKVRK
jgi:hypothetical protein